MSSKINLYFLMLFLSLPVFFSILNLQFYKAAESQDNIAKILNSKNVIQAKRGTITDRNGLPIAEDKEVFDLYLEYKIFSESNTSESCTKMIREIKIYCFIKSFKEENDLNSYLEVSDMEIGDYLVVKSYERYYNYGRDLFHLIGYFSKGDGGSLFGLEKYYDDKLSGQNGIVESFLQTSYTISPESGQNVTLSLDISWQQILSKILANFMAEYDSASVAGIIAEAETGKVVVYVSLPSVDPNVDFKRSNREYQTLINSRGNPLLDKVASVSAPPGSIYKIISSYYLLKEGLVSLDSKYFSNRCIYFDDNTPFCEFGKNFYGLMNIRDALARSSNLFFCHYTIQDILRFQNNFKTYQLLFIRQFNDEQNAFSRANGDIYSPPPQNLYLGDICSAVIGQSYITITPLQALIMFSKLSEKSNSWNIPTFDDDEKTLVSKDDLVVLDRSILNHITEGLKDSVYKPIGTTNFFLGKLSEFNIRSKTGTSEDFENVDGKIVPRTNAWIGGLFDYEGKEYVFTFHSRFGGSGFYISAVLRDFLNCLKFNEQLCL